MTPDRKHPSAAFWITVALLAVLVGYPLSFGPASWLQSRIEPAGLAFVDAVYWPIGWISVNAPKTRTAIRWYAAAGMPDDGWIWLACSPENDKMIVLGAAE